MLREFPLERFCSVLLMLLDNEERTVWIMKRERFQSWVSLGHLVHLGSKAEAPID